MNVERMIDGEHVVEIIDFVVPTVEVARDLIRDGALNDVDLLEQAGLTREQAESELRKLRPSRADPAPTDALYRQD